MIAIHNARGRSFRSRILLRCTSPKFRNIILRSIESDRAWIAEAAIDFELQASDITKLTHALHPLDDDSMSRVSSSLTSLGNLLSPVQVRGVIKNLPAVLIADLQAWFEFLSQIGVSKEQIVLILQQARTPGKGYAQLNICLLYRYPMHADICP